MTSSVKTGSMKIGVFGGTFDPPHFGHISLVVSFIEKLQLDVVYVIPTGSNPLKPLTETQASMRLDMVRLAFRDVPKVVVLDHEVKQGGTCYTIDTLKWMIENVPGVANAKRYLLLGEDCCQQLDQWKDTQTLFTLITPVIGLRAGEGAQEAAKSQQSVALDTFLPEEIVTRRLDISSTEIRLRLLQGLHCSFMVPAPVLEYIKKGRIYGC